MRVSVPLLDENSKYEIYKVHNIPIHIHNTTETKNSDMIAKYTLESDATAGNGDKSEFVLLSNNELEHCANP